ncbi:MAG: imidazole glycerol phosphate synthase subunit HisH [Candidatus Thorarchaeota archaeon]
MEVGVIDYGAGNMYSILCGLQRANIDTKVITEPEEIRSSDAVVIPGVGNFSQACKSLDKFREDLQEVIIEGRILLGVCLGMQVLLERSEEGSGEGLGLMHGSVRRLPSKAKVPHMGWNTITVTNECPLLDGLQENSYFYFIHSYFASPSESANVMSVTEYGIDFPSVIAMDSIYGVQFHPEKSGETGALVLDNFRDVLRR